MRAWGKLALGTALASLALAQAMGMDSFDDIDAVYHARD